MKKLPYIVILSVLAASFALAEEYRVEQPNAADLAGALGFSVIQKFLIPGPIEESSFRPRLEIETQKGNDVGEVERHTRNLPSNSIQNQEAMPVVVTVLNGVLKIQINGSVHEFPKEAFDLDPHAAYISNTSESSSSERRLLFKSRTITSKPIAFYFSRS